jgi:hypothetical protein
MTTYIIKVYKLVDEKFVFLTDLPYVFIEEPHNICNQMNIMMGKHFKHIIAVNA